LRVKRDRRASIHRFDGEAGGTVVS
jgi:hypothetical protein